jgi:hypothetical protein
MKKIRIQLKKGKFLRLFQTRFMSNTTKDNRTAGASPTAEPQNSAVLESTKAQGRGKHGKQGRKKSPEELVYMTRQIFKRQMPITAAEVRAAIDLYRAQKK